MEYIFFTENWIYIRTKICGIYIFNYDISVDLKMSLTPKTSSMATMTQTKDAKWAFCFRISMNHCKISIDIHTLFIVMKKHWEIESIEVGEVTKGWCMMAEWWNYESRTTKNALGHTSWMNSNFFHWQINMQCLRNCINEFCHLLLYTSVNMSATSEPIWYTVIYAIYGVL